MSYRWVAFHPGADRKLGLPAGERRDLQIGHFTARWCPLTNPSQQPKHAIQDRLPRLNSPGHMCQLARKRLFRVHDFLPSHCRSWSYSFSSFAPWSRISVDLVSRVNPIKSSDVVGPSSFSTTTGRPSWSKISNSLRRTSLNSGDNGSPITRKLSS